MAEVQALTEALRQAYGAEDVALHPLAHGDKLVYRVMHVNGTDWVLRAVRVSAEGGYNPLPRMVAVLSFLEEQRFPAERLIRAFDGSPSVQHQGWHLVVTTYLGPTLRAWQPAESDAAAHNAESFFQFQPPATFYQIAQALGQLHALPTADFPSLPTAGMLPARELTYAAGRLVTVDMPVPDGLQSQYDYLCKAVQSVDHDQKLPSVFIHNDPNMGNVVQTPSGELAFIDWDVAGLGPAVIDLGVLLSNCHTSNYRPDHDASRAVVEGYCQQRVLTQAELECLPDAACFQTLVLLAACFPERVTGELGDEQPLYGLTYPQWSARHKTAGEIAKRAVSEFKKCL